MQWLTQLKLNPIGDIDDIVDGLVAQSKQCPLEPFR